MKTHLRKFKDVKLVTLPDVKQHGRDLYIKVMVRRLTTSDTTERVVYAAYQLLSSVVMRIEYDNPNAVDHLVKIIKHIHK